MYIVYFDETGDDGYPNRTTDLFILTSASIHAANWQESYKRMAIFRRYLKTTYGFPVKLEMHTRKFLLNKNPYRAFGWDNATRLRIVKEYADILPTLNLEFINTVINKLRINANNQGAYKPILDAALKFNVQRVQNTISRVQPGTKFLIISDEGRTGIMAKTTRRIQRINFIPSRFNSTSYRAEIDLLLEDPLPKNSTQSHFIQLCDFVSFISYLRLLKTLGVGAWHGRLTWLTEADVEDLLQRMSSCFNHRANSGTAEFGFVIYPR